MGQSFTRNTMSGSGGDFYMGPIYATSLSYDRQTEVRVGEGSGQTVRIGSWDQLPFLETGATKKHEFFKRLGVVVKTRGNRIMQNAEVVIVDYYRMDGKRLVPRNKTHGMNPADWRGTKGPAEASGGLRIGDCLYAINHRLVANKSKGHVLRQVNALLDKNDGVPVILTWKHSEEIQTLPFEEETPLPPPEGVYAPPNNEWGSARPTRISAVDI